ncbi:hypothetical protein HYC85_001880 [Camellia sinensis]|uniref:Prenylcysteine lyase domain-containing protein n=1 Tax=Camellia sinensis TaxID=4442 RepID=A0A7J7I7Y2_CAMSI|nr:hypothetical protein HYC85_001880 [Camellia sinensis]
MKMKMKIKMKMNTMIVFIFTLLFLSTPSSSPSVQSDPPTVCIIGSGIGGSSVAHFLRQYSDQSPPPIGQIRIFERRGRVGGRMATISLAGDTFEAGAVMLHPKNYHAVNFVKFLNLTVKQDDEDDSFSFGIWDGHKFVFKTLDSNSKFPFFQKIVSLLNSFRMFFRYGFSLFKMSNFGESAMDRFLNYYKSCESRPVFETVDEMLKWAGLYNLTTRTLQEELGSRTALDHSGRYHQYREWTLVAGIVSDGDDSEEEARFCASEGESQQNHESEQRETRI